MNNLENNDFYKRALKEVEKYHQPPEGFTTFLGQGQQDTHYPKQLNTIISLLILQHNKLIALETALSRLTIQLDNITIQLAEKRSDNLIFIEEQLSKLNLNPPEKPSSSAVWPFW